MVSTRLRNLAGWLRDAAKAGGATLTPASCGLAASQLEDLAEQAEVMEAQPAPSHMPPAAVAHVAPNVLCLASARRTRADRAAGGDWGPAA